MFDLPPLYERLMPVVLPFAVWLLFLLVFLWLLQRRMEARFAKQMQETRAYLDESRQSQRESKARAEESKARALDSITAQRRGLEIAEQSLKDRQEMLALLRRIAEILESRPQA